MEPKNEELIREFNKHGLDFDLIYYKVRSFMRNLHLGGLRDEDIALKGYEFAFRLSQQNYELASMLIACIRLLVD